MHTLLLDYLIQKNETPVTYNNRYGIVGTDKYDFSPLLTLYENLREVNANCLSV